MRPPRGGGGWANAALSQQRGSDLKQKPMSSLGARGPVSCWGKESHAAQPVSGPTYFSRAWDKGPAISGLLGMGTGARSSSARPAHRRARGAWVPRALRMFVRGRPQARARARSAESPGPSATRAPAPRHTRPRFHE